jgi:alkanesulfonate monooxygenase SsuD/methylene tetrahydromethanopterin reductase-like flavin-dependent oxidoreductase (luciferase family)
VLHALFPGRIDLGLGRAPGTDPRTAAALRRSREALMVDDFPDRLDDLARYLDDDGPPRTGFTGTIRAIPTNVPAPELWMLGSSEGGGRGAARRLRASLPICPTAAYMNEVGSRKVESPACVRGRACLSLPVSTFPLICPSPRRCSASHA